MDIFEKCTSNPSVQLANNSKKEGIYPYCHELQSKQDAVVKMEDKRCIMLGSNNYLGLTVNQEVIDAGKAALDEFGSGCSGSRFVNGTLSLHNKFERDIAEFLGKEDAVVFGTGFQTNLGIISAIAGRGDLVFSDKENHASIYDGCKLSYATMIRYNHNDMESLEQVLKEAPKDKGKLIVTDGVFSMTGDICKLPEIVKLAGKYKARVMVDDAHGFGVLGNYGRGTADYYGLSDKVDLLMGTFSKSLASMGGYCACSKEVANFLRHVSRPYIFCASTPPSGIATANKALDLIKRDDKRQKNLLKLAKYLKDSLDKKGIKHFKSYGDIVPVIPIYTYSAENTFKACSKLFDEGVYVNPVVPPAVPEGECLIRISLMANLTKKLIDEAVGKIEKVLKDLGAM